MAQADEGNTGKANKRKSGDTEQGVVGLHEQSRRPHATTHGHHNNTQMGDPAHLQENLLIIGTWPVALCHLFWLVARSEETAFLARRQR